MRLHLGGKKSWDTHPRGNQEKFMILPSHESQDFIGS